MSIACVVGDMPSSQPDLALHVCRRRGRNFSVLVPHFLTNVV